MAGIAHKRVGDEILVLKETDGGSFKVGCTHQIGSVVRLLARVFGLKSRVVTVRIAEIAYINMATRSR
jgi:hypothetical protein